VIVLGLLKFGSFVGSIVGFRALPQETEPTPATASDDDLSIIVCERFSNKLDGETFEDGRPEERLEDTASGQGYPYSLPDSSLPQTSPRMGRGVSVKQEAGRRPPKQMNNQIGNAQVQQARRMNCVGSSAASNSQPIISHGAPRPSALQYTQASYSITSSIAGACFWSREELPLYASVEAACLRVPLFYDPYPC
jgi:hypothetical protein